MIFCIFYQVNLTGCGFQIGLVQKQVINLIKMQKIIFIIENFSTMKNGILLHFLLSEFDWEVGYFNRPGSEIRYFYN